MSCTFRVMTALCLNLCWKLSFWILRLVLFVFFFILRKKRHRISDIDSLVSETFIQHCATCLLRLVKEWKKCTKNLIKSTVGGLNIKFLGGLKPFYLYEQYKIQMYNIYLADSDTKLRFNWTENVNISCLFEEIFV